VKWLLRLPLVFLGTWGVLLALARVVRLSDDWPLWLIALGAALSVEAILWLFSYEAGAISARRARWVMTLRLAALAMLIWILLGPVWVRKVTHEQQREVVVVLDDSGSMHLVDPGETRSRLEIGENSLKEAGILEKLRESLRVRVVRSARSVRAHDEAAPEGWADSTDLAAALDTVLEQVSPDDLAGVLMVSDGRHNRPGRVEDAARRLGILDAPVGIVAVGSAEPPRDAAVIGVRAPEAIHLGDRMHVAATVKFDGYRGESAKVSLFRGSDLLEERVVAISQDHHREEVRFAQVPEKGGVGGYRVEIEELEGERFSENNAWEFETSITDARTNVLIVESYPRWEFRYLRNLFYGRDKSIHLQYVLLHPDRISRQLDEVIAASAARPFGEAQATRLPQSEAEWRKFDVIILGDVDARALDLPTWEIIWRCVNERAALLVLVAGPRHMPHGIVSETGRALVPAEMEWGARSYFDVPDESFRLALTPEGLRHPVTQQGGGEISNAELWGSFPELRWKHPIKSLKEGAEILLVAAESNDGRPPLASTADLADALDSLSKRRQREAESALLVTRQTGKGKGALLLTDRTWRLREGAGDLYHHRFWGNLVRWGAGPTLRAGGLRARLGTDQLAYTPDDRAKVTVRLRDRTMTPILDETLRAEVLQDGKVLASVPMAPVAGSSGLHEAELERFKNAGDYEVRIAGELADKLISEDGASELKAAFRVVGSHGPLELSETTLNLPLLETISSLSGGKVVAPYRTGELAELFLTDFRQREETRESSLWDNAWVLALLGLLLGGEWIVRRSAGLP
jgi:hypothetical protein